MTRFGLLVILLIALALRLGLLLSPFGEVDADESVVGLMALHILEGERPAFYWGQPYLGSLEAYLVAGAFALFGPSNQVLKLVPCAAFLLFIMLVYWSARGPYGWRIGLASALYLAVPPSFLALWSLKARGGYVELLALGQGLLLAAPWAGAGRGLAGRMALVGLLAGVLIWTHALGLVYVVPAGLYLALRLGRRLVGVAGLSALAGALVGLAPLLAYNLQHDWETLRALGPGGAGTSPLEENLHAFVHIGLPVLLGFGQATSSPILFAQDWPRRPASWRWLPLVLTVAVGLGLVPALRDLLRGARKLMHGACCTVARRAAAALFGLGVLGLTVLLACLGRFEQLVAEPRYALPVYSSVPLFGAVLAALAGGRRWLAATAVAAVLALNIWSLATADPRLNLPTTAGDSTAATRAELITYLLEHDLTEVYTDYWLAYPLIFESGERLMAAVNSGGYNRFAPYAHLVATSPHPAFVFVRGSREEQAFLERLREAGGQASIADVSIYRVYSRVTPLDPLRP